MEERDFKGNKTKPGDEISYRLVPRGGHRALLTVRVCVLEVVDESCEISG